MKIKLENQKNFLNFIFFYTKFKNCSQKWFQKNLTIWFFKNSYKFWIFQQNLTKLKNLSSFQKKALKFRKRPTTYWLLLLKPFLVNSCRFLIYSILFTSQIDAWNRTTISSFIISHFDENHFSFPPNRHKKKYFFVLSYRFISKTASSRFIVRSEKA